MTKSDLGSRTAAIETRIADKKEVTLTPNIVSSLKENAQGVMDSTHRKHLNLVIGELEAIAAKGLGNAKHFTRARLDTLVAEKAKNRKNPLSDEEQIRFREIMLYAWDTAVNNIEASPVADAVLPSQQPAPVARPSAPAEGQRMFRDRVAGGSSNVQLTKFIPNHWHYKAGSCTEKEESLLAFEHPNAAVREKFAKLFHNYGAGYPYVDIDGRELFRDSNDLKVAVCSHYGFEDRGECYLSISKVDRNNEWVPFKPNTEERECAKQAALHLLLDARLIDTNMAQQAGYSPASLGVQCAKEQLRSMGGAAQRR